MMAAPGLSVTHSARLDRRAAGARGGDAHLNDVAFDRELDAIGMRRREHLPAVAQRSSSRKRDKRAARDSRPWVTKARRALGGTAAIAEIVTPHRAHYMCPRLDAGASTMIRAHHEHRAAVSGIVFDSSSGDDGSDAGVVPRAGFSWFLSTYTNRLGMPSRQGKHGAVELS